MATLLRRAALLGMYGIVAFGTIWLFAGGGEGSPLPVKVFSSWAIPLAKLIWPGGAGAVLFIALYYLFLVSVNTILSRRAFGALAAVIVHFAGVAVVMSGNKEAAFLLPSWVIFLLSALIVLLYLWIDWRLAKTPHSRKR